MIRFTNNESGSTATDGFMVGKWSDGTNYIYDYDNYDLILGAHNGNKIRIHSVGTSFYQSANGTPSLGSKNFYAATFENLSAGYGLAIGGVNASTGDTSIQVQNFTTSNAYNLILQPLGGNVGIGTTSPQRKLHISNNGAEGLEFFVGIFANESRINSFNRSSSAWNKFSVGCSTLEFFVGSGDTSAIAISSTANVGIGTNNPGVKLEVAKASPAELGAVARFYHGPASDRSVEVGVYGTTPFRPYIQARTSGSTANELHIQPDGGAAVMGAQLLVTAGSGSSGSYKPGMAISGDDDTGVQQVGGANTLSLVTAGNERLLVTDSRVFINGNGEQYGFGVRYVSTGGPVYFGATSNSATPDAAISNAGGGTLMKFANDGKITAAGVYNNTVGATNRDVFVDSGGLIGYVSSIRQSKINIESLDNVSWLSSLHPVSYFYRKRDNDGDYTEEPDGIKDYGLIAEEVEEIAPELCFYDMIDNEPQLRGVTYSKLITPMLKYIQVLQQEVNELKSRLTSLEQR
jgi:hypothetical protein